MIKKGLLMKNKDNFDSEALEAPETIEMRLEGILWACDFGTFDMPVGAEIDHVSGRWGAYRVYFTDEKKYPPIEVQTEHEVDGKLPDSIRVWDEEGAEHYNDNL